MAFTQAVKQQKRDKIFIYSGPGLFKTRTMLGLGSGPKSEPPTLAVIDCEFGTDHYADEFHFMRDQTVDPDAIMKTVKDIAAKPGSIRTLGVDTFSLYYEALTSKYVDLYLKRELRSAGHKQEYYVLQPRDYNPINREAGKLVRLLLKSDLNIICLCQQKDLWGEDMKVAGTTFDGWKRLGYYFDTVLEILPKDKKTKTDFVCYIHKDRSNHLEKFKSYPWGSDSDNIAWLKKAGFNLTAGPAAESYVEPVPTTQPQKQASEPAQPKTTTPEAPALAPEAPKLAIVDPAVQALVDDAGPTTATTGAEKQPPAQDALAAGEHAIARTKDDLLHEVVQLKMDCRINSTEWPQYISPYKVATAREMTNGQLMELIATLKSVKNSPARSAA